MQKESFGMMDEGYFVPRGQIIDWINNLLNLNITKIQMLGSGAIYCQIVDVIHPGKVSMNKVNWKAKNQYEFIANLKILQTAFDKAGVKRYVEVQKLAKAKYQDNLQFIQWLKRYYDINCGDRGKDYDGNERRGNAQVDFSFAEKNVVPKSFNAGGQIIGNSKTDLPGKKASLNVPSKNLYEENKHQNKSPVKKKEEKPQKSTAQKPNWEKLYHEESKVRKELQVRLGMIQQIMNSSDDSNTKVAMINQILQSQNEQMEVEHGQHEEAF